MRIAKNVIGFKGVEDEFSNTFPCLINYKNVLYSCSEISYQHQKAILHEEFEIADKIISCGSPFEAMKIAKEININPAWHAIKDHLMYSIAVSKIEQNGNIKHKLMTSREYILAECTNNHYWGIGCDYTSDRWTEPTFWNGKNKMGGILMNIRSQLRLGGTISKSIWGPI